MIGAARTGFSRAVGAPRLVALLWLLKLALAAAFAAPGWLALRSWIGVLPEADPLRRGLSLSVLADLAELRPGFFSGLTLSALGLAVLGLLAGVAAAGGVLNVLRDRDGGAIAGRFGSGAFRFFGPFLRVELLAVPVAAIVLALVATPLALLVQRTQHSAAAVSVASRVALAAVVALVLLLALAAVDAARISLVREDGRRALRALRSGLGLVLRRPVRWAGVRVVNVVLVAAVLAAQAVVESRLPGSSHALLLCGLLLAQAAAFAQSGLSVALRASELALWDAQRGVPRPAQLPPEPLVEPEPTAPEAAPPEPSAPGGEDENRPR